MRERREGALAAVVVVVLVAFAVGSWLWTRRLEPRAREAEWWAQGGWRVNAVVDPAKPLVLTYNLWTSATAAPDTMDLEPVPAGDFQVVQSNLAHEVDVEGGRTYQLCRLNVSVRFSKNYLDHRIGFLVNAGPWKRILPYGRVTCRVVRTSVNWLDVSFVSGEIQEPFVMRDNLIALTLRNDTKAPVRMLSLWQAGDDGISGVRVVLSGTRTAARPARLPFTLKPGQTALLQYVLQPHPGTVQQGLIFQPALVLRSGRTEGFEVMPPVVIERAFQPWQRREAPGVVPFVEAVPS
ncbi:MAG: hypothetical protein K6T76_01440 [Alicyclobacillus mali]|uniref:hypothetical protein n=1 Tax=Alicyclobacillus mali (ex Roth et al. 2021) TaxID=1123961 RepID=UPI00083407A7|nr:hypothetical protein [Alicyclobacillus mali (ex Roth et al. 2021)]MCL6487593.1 hypothetical protein [Alicyclobacillus mali (ex Roth et al. 2021)]